MNAEFRILIAGTILLCASGAFGQTSSSPAAPTPSAATTSAPAAEAAPVDYTIGPKDLLDIKVFEIPELNLERRVTDAGTIDLPLLGDFSVSGLTPAQARDKLQNMLTAKYVNRANVSITIKEFTNKPLSVLGAVQKPGSLMVSGRYTLLQAISAAGGLTDRAGKTIYVMRRGSSGVSDTLEVTVEDLLHGSSSQWDVPLQPGDVVNVEAKRTVRVFCLGAVKNPGALEFDGDDRLTLLSVIAKAGGLTDKAASKMRIKRRGADGKDSEMVVNFSRVVSGKDPDPVLKADDIVVVKESFF